MASVVKKRVVNKVATKKAATKVTTKLATKVATKPAAKGVVAKSSAKPMSAPQKAAAANPVRKPAVRKIKDGQEMTDEDILRAPEKDYMNDAQRAFFRQKLLELRAQLLNNADDTGQHLRENEVTTDPSDRATLEEEYTLELRTRDRERKLLKKVEKSIKQIDDGTYGFCEETGEPIGVARLLARPTATLSLEAQERRERVQKLYGD